MTSERYSVRSYTSDLLRLIASTENPPKPFPQIVNTSAPAMNDHWEKFRQQIRHIYLEEDRTLKELMVTMKDKYGFEATCVEDSVQRSHYV